MQNDVARDTNSEDLLRAVEIGRQSGLRHIYAGNLPGRVGECEDTRCPKCNEALIERYGYLIKDYRLTADGHCPKCATPIPGRWSAHFEGQITSRPFLPRKRSLLFTIENR
jgi:pyruvate formate lyase activating enzyme